MFQHNALNTGRLTYSIQGEKRLKWIEDIGPSSIDRPSQNTQPVVGDDGTIYFGVSFKESEESSYKSRLYALYPRGEMKWRTTDLKGRLFGTPAISITGNIYVGTTGKVYALYPDGNIKWEFSCTSEDYVSSITIGPDGTLYFACGSWFYALSQNGQEKWHFRDKDSVYNNWRSFSTPAVGANGTIYTVYPGSKSLQFSRNGILYAIEADGSLKWTTRLYYEMSPPVVGGNGNIYTNSGYLYSIKPKGDLSWSKEVTGSSSGGGETPVIDTEGNIIVASYDYLSTLEKLKKFDPQGAELWSFESNKYSINRITSLFTDIEGDIYILGDGFNSKLLGLDKTGTIEWSREISGFGGLSVGKNDRIYAGSLLKKENNYYQVRLNAFGKAETIGFETFQDQSTDPGDMSPGSTATTQVIDVADDDSNGDPIYIDKVKIENKGDAQPSDIDKITVKALDESGLQEEHTWTSMTSFPLTWEPKDTSFSDQGTGSGEVEVTLSEDAVDGRTIKTKLTVEGTESGTSFNQSATDGVAETINEEVNRPPNLPTSLTQLQYDGSGGIEVGKDLLRTKVAFTGEISDPDGDQVKLQVELRRLDEYGGNFDETKGGFKESDLFNSGTEAITSAEGLIAGDYHWRARTIDENNNKSDWVEFGDNDTSSADFSVLSNESPTAKLSITPSESKAGDWVTFDASESADPDGEIDFYKWDWNNDGFYEEITTLPKWEAQYTQAGTYEVGLTVVDKGQAISDKRVKTVTVKTSFTDKIGGFFENTWPWGNEIKKIEDEEMSLIKQQLGIDDWLPNTKFDWYTDHDLKRALNRSIDPDKPLTCNSLIHK